MGRIQIIILAFILSSSQCFAASSITQYGITWTFNSDYTTGQFITGDYWIVDPGSGVVVSSVSPSPAGGENGSMINPVPRGDQAFDGGTEAYNANLLVSFPATLYSGDALLSSISRLPGDTVDLNGGGLGESHFLKTVAVLTVLSSAPPYGTFRPSYCDRSQHLYNISQINTSILPELTPRITPNNVSGYERNFERPWILFGNDWQGRYIHPYDNMPGYHRFIGTQLSDACMFLMTNSTSKTNVLRGFIQVGIDYYYSSASDSSTWLWPVIFTGLLLNESDMYNYWIDNQSLIPGTREGDKLYYIDEREVSQSSSIISSGKTWVEWQTPEGRYVGFAKQVGEEHEHLHPSEWSALDIKNENYRADLDVYPWIGMHLSSMLVDKKTAINVRAKFVRNQAWDYSDRWMNDGFTTAEYRNTGRTYLQEMQSNVSIPYYLYNSSGIAWVDAMWTDFRNYTPGTKYKLKSITQETP